MQITFKLYASLGQFLPEAASDHAALIEIADGTTINELIDRYHVPRPLAHLVLVNGAYVEPEQRAQPLLKDGDVLAIWPPVAGG